MGHCEFSALRKSNDKANPASSVLTLMGNWRRQAVNAE